MSGTELQLVGHESQDQQLRLSGDGVFATYQGEGVTAGRPSVFVRLQDCNLHCGRDGIGWRCDADYTWDKTMPEYYEGVRNVTVDDLAKELDETWASAFPDMDLTRNLVISGGEPLLQQRSIASLVGRLANWDIEVETNGTIPPSQSLEGIQFNCSPKLASSGNTMRARRRPMALQGIARMPNHWFKFVITSQADVDEIKDVMQVTNGGDFSRVLLMAEGVTREELDERQSMINRFAGELGCRVTERNHIYWFGNKRRT